MIEDLTFQDYICFTVDCVKIEADGITRLTYFIPGPNVTSVRNHKKKILPWKHKNNN